MSQSDFLTFISKCSQEIVNEIEVRTKGQHNNPLWVSARAARITASNFHEIKTTKKILHKIRKYYIYLDSLDRVNLWKIMLCTGVLNKNLLLKKGTKHT